MRDYLKNLVADRTGGSADKRLEVETEVERRRRMLRQVIEKITANGGGLRMADNLSREELYARERARVGAQAAGGSGLMAAGAAERRDRKGG